MEGEVGGGGVAGHGAARGCEGVVGGRWVKGGGGSGRVAVRCVEVGCSSCIAVVEWWQVGVKLCSESVECECAIEVRNRVQWRQNWQREL